MIIHIRIGVFRFDGVIPGAGVAQHILESLVTPNSQTALRKPG